MYHPCCDGFPNADYRERITPGLSGAGLCVSRPTPKPITKELLTMKRLILFGVALFATASIAFAQQYTVTSLTLATNGVPASSTDAGDSSAVTVTKQAEVGIACTAQGSNASSSGNVTFTFVTSLDGTTYQTTGTRTVVVALAGVAAVTTVTNFYLGPIGYLKLTSVQNADSTYLITNLVVKASQKPIDTK